MCDHRIDGFAIRKLYTKPGIWICHKFFYVNTACVKSHQPEGEGGGMVSEEPSSTCAGGGLAC